jgi:hypothetical protein
MLPSLLRYLQFCASHMKKPVPSTAKAALEQHSTETAIY